MQGTSEARSRRVAAASWSGWNARPTCQSKSGCLSLGVRTTASSRTRSASAFSILTRLPADTAGDLGAHGRGLISNLGESGIEAPEQVEVFGALAGSQSDQARRVVAPGVRHEPFDEAADLTHVDDCLRP